MVYMAQAWSWKSLNILWSRTTNRCNVRLMLYAGMEYALRSTTQAPALQSLKHIVRLLPEFIKLDIFLVRDIDKDPVKRAVVAGMLGVASQIGGKVIAEGVETPEELRVLFELGVEWAQGFYLGRPGPIPSGLLAAPLGSHGGPTHR